MTDEANRSVSTDSERITMMAMVIDYYTAEPRIPLLQTALEQTRAGAPLSVAFHRAARHWVAQSGLSSWTQDENLVDFAASTITCFYVRILSSMELVRSMVKKEIQTPPEIVQGCIDRVQVDAGRQDAYQKKVSALKDALKAAGF